MKSIKPGRGPSMMGGIAGVFVAVFGVFWTIMATAMGYKAVELLAQGIGNRVVAEKHGQIMDFDIEEALAMQKTIDKNYFAMTAAISL